MIIHKKHYQILLGLFAVFLCIAFFIIPSPDSLSRSFDAIWDFGHIILFALLTIIIFKTFPQIATKRKFHHLALTIVLSFALGLMIEALQIVVNRTFSLKDVNYDVMGSVLGWFFVNKIYKQCPDIKNAAIIVVFVIWAGFSLTPSFKLMIDDAYAAKKFPVLADFTTPYEYTRWSGENVDYKIAKQTQSGVSELVVEFLKNKNYSNLHFKGFFSNWSGYEHLIVELRSLNKHEFELNLRIHDKSHFRNGVAHSDRFNRVLSVAPGHNKYKIKLTDIQKSPVNRRMDMESIEEIILFFHNNQKASSKLHILRLKLI